MAPVLLLLQLLTFCGIAIAIGMPAHRRRIGLAVFAVGIAALVASFVEGSADRTLEVSHRFMAEVGLNVENKEFPIETVTAPGWHWGALAAAFCFLWALALRLGSAAEPGTARALAGPLLLGFSGALLQLGFEKAAAPMELLAPFDLALERALFPATVLGSMLLARPGRKVLHLVLYLTLFIAVTRLPIALFATLATRGEWGTHLDVHGTTVFVPPGGGTSIGGIETEPGSTEQLFWLVWAPQLVLYPMVYMMSAGSAAFLRLMAARQREVNAAGS